MINAEELLKPISDEKPCGEDLSYDAGLQELDTLMKGKPETQFSPAEPPDWKQLHERCLELWGRSKDLRVATTLSLSSLKMDGLPAFRESLIIVKGLIEGHWDTFYPLLDPTDNNDPTQRVNLIAALATPLATYGDPMRLLERLREAPLTDSRQLGRFGLSDIANSETGTAGADGKPAVSADQIAGAFRDTSPETLQQISQAVTDSIQLIKDIDKILTDKVGSDNSPDLAELPKQLVEIQKRLAPYAGGPAAEAGSAEAAAADGATAGGAPGPGKAISGEVQSRQDVTRMLEKICEYYRRNEPSSPVPFILQRAQRWAEMDFMQIIGDVTPDALGEIQKITGDKPKTE
ncbi:MAG TPA: type VI secretion system protein TssA [Verrucomicrobiae bacterium]